MKNITIWVLPFLMMGCSQEAPKKDITQEAKKDYIQITKTALSKITLDTVKLMNDSDEFSAVGEVNFDENNVVRVYPIVSGTVEEVAVSLGDYVKKGELLATLLSTDISMYQKDYTIAQENLQVANRELQRAKELYTTHVISEKELQDAQKEYNNANTEFNERKQVLSLYGGSSLKHDALYRVYAPINGFIVERNINNGVQIRTDNSTNLFTISDLNSVWVWANIYESDIAKVRERDDVQVSTIAYPEKVFKGEINRISNVLTPQSRVVRVRIQLDNKEHLLKPAMFATVLITPTHKEKILAVPTQALIMENSGFVVMRATKADTFEKIAVKTGKVFKDYTQVLEGLDPNDRIALDGALFLQNAFNLQ